MTLNPLIVEDGAIRKFISRMGVRKTVPGRGLPGLRGFSDGWSAVLQELDFGFCLQPNLAVLHLDRVFDGLTPVLFADLVGFLLHKRGEAVDVAGYRLASFFLSVGERVVKLLYTIMFSTRIGAQDGKRLLVDGGPGCGCRSGCRVSYSVDRVVLWFVLLWTHALHGEQSILGTTVPFLAD